MYGFEIVQLKHHNQQNLRLSEIPPISTFNVFIKGNLDDAEFYIKLEAEADSDYEIREKLDQQRKNLKLYLNLITESQIDVIPGYEPEVHNKKIIHDPDWQKTLKSLQDSTISKFVTSRHSQQDIMLQLGLNEVFSNDIFNGFPKLINWLDENDKKGASRFCSLRDACYHGSTDVAYKKVGEMFPGEFEFEGNILRRDSDKNIHAMVMYLPEVLTQIKKVFKRRFSNSP